MARTIGTGIDIGTSFIRVVVSEFVKGEPTPVVLALTQKRTRGLRRGYIVDLDEARASLKEAIIEAEKTAGVKIDKAYLSLGGISLESVVADGSVAISRADSEIGDLDIKRAIEASELVLKKSVNRHIIQSLPLQYKIDGKKVFGRPSGMRGEILEVRTLFITCLTQHMDDLLSIVEDAGIMVLDLIPSPLAASLVTLTKIQKTAGCLLADIGAETVSIVVFEEGVPISLKIFSIGSTDITNDIALGLKISLEEAEEIKISRDSAVYSKKKLEEIISARLIDIFDLVEAHLKKIGKSGLLPAGITIVGGGSNISAIEQHAKGRLNLPAKTSSLSIMSTIPISQSPDSQLIKKNIDSSWAVAYGLSTITNDREPEGFLGTRFVKDTKNSLVKWLKQFLP